MFQSVVLDSEVIFVGCDSGASFVPVRKAPEDLLRCYGTNNTTQQIKVNP